MWPASFASVQPTVGCVRASLVDVRHRREEAVTCWHLHGEAAGMGQVHKPVNDTALAAMGDGDLAAPVMAQLAQVPRRRGVGSWCGRARWTRPSPPTEGHSDAQPALRRHGHFGWVEASTLIGDEDWDVVILVRYPTRRQFLDMPLILTMWPSRRSALRRRRFTCRDRAGTSEGLRRHAGYRRRAKGRRNDETRSAKLAMSVNWRVRRRVRR